MVPIHVNKELHKKGARSKKTCAFANLIYMIYQAAPKVKILTLPKQFGLTAKSFFCFARADFNDITYEKQHIPQQEQGRSHKKV